MKQEDRLLFHSNGVEKQSLASAKKAAAAGVPNCGFPKNIIPKTSFKTRDHDS